MPLNKEKGSVSAIIKRYGIRAKKKYGQNFLTDENTLNKIVSNASISKEDIVIEIGPGTGSLTRRLSEAAEYVFAFEIDEGLIPVLNETLRPYGNVTVIKGDILKVDINQFLEEQNIRKKVCVVANLPYYITTPILMMLLEAKAPIKSITVMIQKEVAERLTSPPGRKTYGALTLAAAYYSQPEILMEVPPSCFIPPPKVQSTVVRLKIREAPPVSVKDEKMLFSVIRASFNQRRKTLFNGLKNDPKVDVSPEIISGAIEKLGRGSSVRGEQLSLEEFAYLTDLLIP